MDNADSTVAESHLGRFTVVFPLPYRIALIITTGIWAWGFNLKVLSRLGINVTSLIQYTSQAGPGNPPWQRIFRLATTAFMLLAVSILIFWGITQGDEKVVISWQFLPLSYFVVLIALFVLPLKRLSKNGRYRFLATLKRISIGGIAEAQDGKFGDILLADALTSYSKVLGDIFIGSCMLFSGVPTTGKPNWQCGGPWPVAFVISIPFFIRLRQCLIEYGRVRRNPTKSSGWGGQHLANALKYSTAFPVIFLSAALRVQYSPGLNRAWVAASVINSLYSFYWDVAKDWDLTIFSSLRAYIASDAEPDDLDHSWGLRRRLHFHPMLYYVVIFIDFVLRASWSLKLNHHLDEYYQWEEIIFALEVLEVFRRWVWTFLRVETEWVRSNHGPMPDDILLGEYERTNFTAKLDID